MGAVPAWPGGKDRVPLCPKTCFSHFAAKRMGLPGFHSVTGPFPYCFFTNPGNLRAFQIHCGVAQIVIFEIFVIIVSISGNGLFHFTGNDLGNVQHLHGVFFFSILNAIGHHCIAERTGRGDH